MSELQKILEESKDTRSVVEQCLDLLLDDGDREAIESALRSPMVHSSTISVALRSDAAIRDEGLNPSEDAVYSYRRRRGWIVSKKESM